MWSTNRSDRCLRSILLTINCSACIAILYIYLKYVGEQERINARNLDNFIQSEKLTGGNCSTVCESRACIWHANMILRNINSNVDPCDDFRHFLCGGFQRKFGVEESGSLVKQTRTSMIIKLKDILDNLRPESGSASEKMKTVYDSCVNYGSNELKSLTDLKNFLNNLGFVNWPFLAQDFHFENASLPVILANFIVYAPAPYIAFERHPENATHPDNLKITFILYRFKKIVDVPRDLAVSMLKYFDLEAEEMETIIRDHELVKNSIIDLYESDNGCNKEKCFPVFINCSVETNDEWFELCETLNIVLNLSKTSDVNMKAIVSEDKEMFYKNLLPLLHSHTNRSIANFVGLNFLKGYQEELNFYYRLKKLKHKDFMRKSDIDTYELDRWKYCVRWIANNLLLLSLENEFFRQYLTDQVTEEMTSIYYDISSEVTDLISLQEWIPTDLKTELENSLKNTEFNINSISQILPNDEYINKIYQKFLPTSDSFFKNVLRLKRHGLNIQFSINMSNSAETQLFMTGFDVNAAMGQLLVLHFGILFPPFYIPAHSNFINRVLLTPIIAHEFGHAIFETIKWPLLTDEKFLEKEKCLRNQFSRFKFENLNEYLNGSRYDHENVPDNIGTIIIDKIIEKYSTLQDVILPALPYSTAQLAYMSTSQMWCSKSNLEKDLHYKNEDAHAPSEFRLMGMIQNSRGHPAAFNCSERSFMNPTNKCSFLDTNRN